MNPVDLATKVLGCNDCQFAKKMGVARTAVAKWRKNSKIPARRLPMASRLTDLPISVLNDDFRLPCVLSGNKEELREGS